MTEDDALFSTEQCWGDDPMAPGLERVTSADSVAALTRPQRETRVLNLIEQAHQIVDAAWEKHGTNRTLVAKCVLYSGGNDSTVLAHLMKDHVQYAVHCNTTIGLEETRRFVRATCEQWQLPLLERFPPKSYRELITDPVNGGFPGPAMHFKMYTRLKERCLDQVRRELVTNPRKQRVMFIAGRRRSESRRRAGIPLYERKGSVVWASPIAMWTKPDMNMYRLMMGDVPTNPVTEILHMSGECLCGAFAKPGELEEIRTWFPDMAAEIDELMEAVKNAGWEEPHCTWGHRSGGKPSNKTGMLCTSCEFTHDHIPTLDFAGSDDA